MSPVVPKPRSADEQIAEIWEMLRKLKRTGITGQNGAAGLSGAPGATGATGATGPPGPGHIIEDEGVVLPAEPNLDFVGAGVTVTDAAPNTVVTIPGGLLLPTVSTPARVLNVAFKPSLTRPVFGIYSVRIDMPPGAVLQAGRIELRSDATATPTTVRCQTRLSTLAPALLVSIDLSTDGVLSYIVPAGHNVVIASVIEAGAPAFTIQRQTEEAL